MIQESHQQSNMVGLGLFVASGPVRLAIIEGNMNSALYQEILKDNVQPSLCSEGVGCIWVIQVHL